AQAQRIWVAHARHRDDTTWTIPRVNLAGQPRAVIIGVLHHAHQTIAGAKNLDTRNATSLRRIADSVADGSGKTRTFRAGGICVTLQYDDVCINLSSP
ncbi:MAG: hypothetical protein AAF235_11700, partial [Planctomycetota bacterium]